MGKPKSAVSKAMADAREEIQALDLRRQAQISNQVEIIDRLLDGASYDDVMKNLVERLSDSQVRLAAAEAENSRLQAERDGEG